MRAVRPVLIVLAVLCAIAAGVHYVRSPEKETLDADARAGAPGAFVVLGAGTTHYEVAGPDTGRVALLVHGFSVPYYIWDSTFSALSGAGYRVIRYDLFGRGLSDRPRATYDGAFFDAQISDLLDSLHVSEPVDLFGLSFGGFVVAHYASTHPQRIRTITMVDPASSRPGTSALFTGPLVGPYLWQVLAVPTMADNQATDFLHPERFPGWADRYRAQMRYRGFGRALLRSRNTLAATDFDGLFQSVAATGVPVLLVWGKQDPTVPLANAEIVRRAIPALEFFPVDSSGHLPHLEQTAAFNARMFEFLGAHPRAQAAPSAPRP